MAPVHAAGGVVQMTHTGDIDTVLADGVIRKQNGMLTGFDLPEVTRYPVTLWLSWKHASATGKSSMHRKWKRSSVWRSGWPPSTSHRLTVMNFYSGDE